MNWPTILVLAVVAILFVVIVGRGIYNKKHRNSGCGCGCGSCPNSCNCHPQE